MCDRAKLAKNYISNQYVRPYAIYDESMKMEYDDNSRVMINLEQAIEKNEFCVYYQPVYDAKTEEIVSAEALVRWIRIRKIRSFRGGSSQCWKTAAILPSWIHL